MNRPILLLVGMMFAGLIALLSVPAGLSPTVAANIAAKHDVVGTDSADTDSADDDSRDITAATTSIRASIDAALAAAETPAQRFHAQQSAAAGELLGDAHLRDDIDLKRARLVGDAYVLDLPRDGGNAILTLDHVLQEAAEQALTRARAKQAAVVVMSVDGRVLALAGRRGTRNAPHLATEVWAPAASVFKVVTATSLVQKGVRPDNKVCYHGGIRSVMASNLRDDRRRDKRCNTLSYAVAKSQNAIIAKLAHKHLQPDDLRATARAFGFEDLPPSALPARAGRADIPDAKLPFARVAAGFWQTELSPLGGALLTATIASSGHTVTPQIVSEVRRDGQRLLIEPVPYRRVIPHHVARDVTRMMVGTTEYGTARRGFLDARGRRFLPDVPVAGKTGTLTRRSPSYMQYSWFVGFAPADEPEFVIAVLIGNPERWHLKAHTAARMVLQKAF